MDRVLEDYLRTSGLLLALLAASVCCSECRAHVSVVLEWTAGREKRLGWGKEAGRPAANGVVMVMVDAMG